MKYDQSTAQHSTTQNGALWHSLAWDGMTWHSTARHGTARHGTARRIMARHGTAQHNIARYSTAQHSTAQHSALWHSTVQCDTAWHSTRQVTACLEQIVRVVHDHQLHNRDVQLPKHTSCARKGVRAALVSPGWRPFTGLSSGQYPQTCSDPLVAACAAAIV